MRHLSKSTGKLEANHDNLRPTSVSCEQGIERIAYRTITAGCTNSTKFGKKQVKSAYSVLINLQYV
jgi:hypothetical protein